MWVKIIHSRAALFCGLRAIPIFDLNKPHEGFCFYFFEKPTTRLSGSGFVYKPFAIVVAVVTDVLVSRFQPKEMGRTPCCMKMGLNRGPWTPDEDLRLTSYIKSHGEGGWRTLPKKAGLLRCGKSCRLRWMNYLRPNVKRGHISPEEEDLILRLHRLLGNRYRQPLNRFLGNCSFDLSKKLISQGIDPRTHKPLSESHDAIMSDTSGNTDTNQKSSQQDAIEAGRENAKDENLTDGTFYCGDVSEGITASTNANGDHSTINANEDHSTITKKDNDNAEGASLVCNPQPTSVIDFCQVDMSWKPSLASVNLQFENYTSSMGAVDTNALSPVFLECDSDRRNKQIPLAINNLPFITNLETSEVGVAGHDYFSPYMMNNSFEMTSATRGSALQYDTPFYGHYSLAGNDRNNSPFISRNPYRENNQMYSNISLEMPDGLHACDIEHISRSVPEEAAFISSNTKASNPAISAVCDSHTFPITTPVTCATIHGNCNSETFPSFFESFANEEFILPELCPQAQATNFGYDVWSTLLSPTGQDRPSD